MKHTAAIAYLAFLAAAAPSSASHYHVYLLGGQSNGNGRADAAQLTAPLDAPQTDVRFYWHRTQATNNVGHLPEDQWIALAPGSGHGTGAPVYPKEFGPEVSFGRAIADAKPSYDIAIIKYTHGGTNLASNWSATGTQYTTFVSTVQAGLAALTSAGHTYELRGMLWQQGEADTSGSSADNYGANLTNLIARVRTDLFAGGALPFVIGSLSNSQYSNITTVGSGPYKVRQAQEAVAAADPLVGIVITDGYGVRSDVIHLNHNGQIALGQNFSTQMLLLEGPDVTAPQLATKSPADNAIGVAPNSNLVATFDEPIALKNGGTVTIRDLGAAPDLVITIPNSQVTVSGKDLIIAPAADLLPGNPYAIRISGNAVEDLAPTPNAFGGIANDTIWNFTTGSTGSSAPQVLSLDPADNATGISANANLVINFNESVKKGSSGNIVIIQSGGSTFETIPIADARISVSGQAVTINPGGTFASNTAYHVQVTAGAIEDLTGNPWDGIAASDATTWNFITSMPGNAAGTTGVFDENADATNQLDVEIPGGTLGAFKTAVQTAYNNNLGGVIDWETGVTATASSGSSARNTITSVGATYGGEAAKTLAVTFDRSMELYTNDINGQVSVLSRQGTFHNALIPAGSTATALEYTMAFSGTGIIELGAAIPSRSSYGTLGVDFQATANYSGGGSGILDFTVGGALGTSDTFLHFAAPPGKTITSLRVAFVDDNGQSLTDGQRRPILDDVGFVTASPATTFATWIGNPAFGLPPSQQGFGDDPDGDHLANGLEAWLGSHPGRFSQGLAPGVLNGNAFTSTHSKNESPPTDLSGFYEWSPNLSDWYAGDGTDGPPGGITAVISTGSLGSTTTVTTTASEAAERLFLRLGVSQTPNP